MLLMNILSTYSTTVLYVQSSLQYSHIMNDILFDYRGIRRANTKRFYRVSVSIGHTNLVLEDLFKRISKYF